MPRPITFHVAVLLLLCCIAPAPIADAWATPLERVEFDSGTQRLVSGASIPPDRIQGELAKPAGVGPFAAVIGLHGCGGMHDTTRQRLVDALVPKGYVLLLVESHATRGIEHACTTTAFATFLRRRPDVWGALLFLGSKSFVDTQRVAAVGFSAGGRVALSAAVSRSFDMFDPPGDVRLRAAVAFNPPCSAAFGRPEIPTLIMVGELDDWTPAADCRRKLADWGGEGPPVELVIYANAHHGFFYPHLQPGTVMFNHRVEYNEEAAEKSTRRMLEFLERHLK